MADIPGRVTHDALHSRRCAPWLVRAQDLDASPPRLLQSLVPPSEAKSIDKIDCILNNSFGILNINSGVAVGRLEKQNREYGWMVIGA